MTAPNQMLHEDDLSPNADNIEYRRAEGQRMVDAMQRSAQLAKVINLATNQELMALHDALNEWIKARYHLDAQLRRILERAEGLPKA